MRIKRAVGAAPLALTLLYCLRCSSARADGLAITTIEHGSWPIAVAAFQVDLESEGDRVHVRVIDGSGRPAPCGTYTLTLDPAGARAFEIGDCDPATDATAVRLVHRAALFDHDEEGISRPRSIDIVASRLERTLVGGGAEVTPESTVSCSADVQPYLPDLENGTRVALTPGRYELRTESLDVCVIHDAFHWTLRRTTPGPLSVSYEIVETRTGAVLLRDQVELGCRGGEAVVPAVRPAVARVAASPPPTESRAWEASSLSVSFLPGIALLRPSGVTFENQTGTLAVSDLGIPDVAGAALGLMVSYERPWLFTALGVHTAIAPQGGRTLFEMGGTATVAAALRIGPLAWYFGPTAALDTYQLSGIDTTQLEWGSRAEAGLGLSSGLRIHLRGAGSSLAILGIDVTAPIVGHQPWLITASIGGGAGH